MDGSPPSSSVHGILQGRRLEWVAMPSSRGSSQPRDRTQATHIAGEFLTVWAAREAQEYWSGWPIPSPGNLPNPGISLGSPTLQVDSLPAEPPQKPLGSSVLLQMALFHYFFNGWVILHCIYVPHLLYPFLCWWIFRLLLCPGCHLLFTIEPSSGIDLLANVSI